MAKTDATRGHAGGGREPLVDSAFNPGSRLRQRLPPPPDASPPRSAFLSEFVAKTAASVLPTEPAANARGVTASKPPRRKVKFSRHVHGFRFTQAEREFLVSVYDRNEGRTPDRNTCEAIARAFTASPVRNPQGRLTRPRRHTTGSMHAPKPLTLQRNNGHGANSTATAPGGSETSPLNALLRMRAQQDAAVRGGRDISETQQRRHPRHHLPGVSLDDFCLLDSESPMFPSCMLDEGTNAVSEVKSASDDEWEIAKAPEDDCSEMVADAATERPSQPASTLPAFPQQLADLFSTEYRTANDPTAAMVHSLSEFRCWSGNLADVGLLPAKVYNQEEDPAAGSDHAEPVHSDDDSGLIISAEDDDLDVELYANLTRGSRTGRWIPLNNSGGLGQGIEEIAHVKADSEDDVDMIASATAELGDGEKHPVQWKQIKTWFENRRMTQKRISEGRDRPPRRPKAKRRD